MPPGRVKNSVNAPLGNNASNHVEKARLSLCSLRTSSTRSLVKPSLMERCQKAALLEVSVERGTLYLFLAGGLALGRFLGASLSSSRSERPRGDGGRGVTFNTFLPSCRGNQGIKKYAAAFVWTDGENRTPGLAAAGASRAFEFRCESSNPRCFSGERARVHSSSTEPTWDNA